MSSYSKPVSQITTNYTSTPQQADTGLESPTAQPRSYNKQGYSKPTYSAGGSGFSKEKSMFDSFNQQATLEQQRQLVDKYVSYKQDNVSYLKDYIASMKEKYASETNKVRNNPNYDGEDRARKFDSLSDEYRIPIKEAERLLNTINREIPKINYDYLTTKGAGTYFTTDGEIKDYIKQQAIAELRDIRDRRDAREAEKAARGPTKYVEFIGSDGKTKLVTEGSYQQMVSSGKVSLSQHSSAKGATASSTKYFLEDIEKTKEGAASVTRYLQEQVKSGELTQAQADKMSKEAYASEAALLYINDPAYEYKSYTAPGVYTTKTYVNQRISDMMTLGKVDSKALTTELGKEYVKDSAFLMQFGGKFEEMPERFNTTITIGYNAGASFDSSLGKAATYANSYIGGGSQIFQLTTEGFITINPNANAEQLSIAEKQYGLTRDAIQKYNKDLKKHIQEYKDSQSGLFNEVVTTEAKSSGKMWTSDEGVTFNYNDGSADTPQYVRDKDTNELLDVLKFEVNGKALYMPLTQGYSKVSDTEIKYVSDEGSPTYFKLTDKGEFVPSYTYIDGKKKEYYYNTKIKEYLLKGPLEGGLIEVDPNLIPNIEDKQSIYYLGPDNILWKRAKDSATNEYSIIPLSKYDAETKETSKYTIGPQGYEILPKGFERREGILSSDELYSEGYFYEEKNGMLERSYKYRGDDTYPITLEEGVATVNFAGKNKTSFNINKIELPKLYSREVNIQDAVYYSNIAAKGIKTEVNPITKIKYFWTDLETNIPTSNTYEEISEEVPSLFKSLNSIPIIGNIISKKLDLDNQRMKGIQTYVSKGGTGSGLGGDLAFGGRRESNLKNKVPSLPNIYNYIPIIKNYNYIPLTIGYIDEWINRKPSEDQSNVRTITSKIIAAKEAKAGRNINTNDFLFKFDIASIKTLGYIGENVEAVLNFPYEQGEKIALAQQKQIQGSPLEIPAMYYLGITQNIAPFLADFIKKPISTSVRGGLEKIYFEEILYMPDIKTSEKIQSYININVLGAEGTLYLLPLVTGGVGAITKGVTTPVLTPAVNLVKPTLTSNIIGGISNKYVSSYLLGNIFGIGKIGIETSGIVQSLGQSFGIDMGKPKTYTLSEASYEIGKSSAAFLSFTLAQDISNKAFSKMYIEESFILEKNENIIKSKDKLFSEGTVFMKKKLNIPFIKQKNYFDLYPTEKIEIIGKQYSTQFLINKEHSSSISMFIGKNKYQGIYQKTNFDNLILYGTNISPKGLQYITSNEYLTSQTKTYFRGEFVETNAGLTSITKLPSYVTKNGSIGTLTKMKTDLYKSVDPNIDFIFQTKYIKSKTSFTSLKDIVKYELVPSKNTIGKGSFSLLKENYKHEILSPDFFSKNKNSLKSINYIRVEGKPFTFKKIEIGNNLKPYSPTDLFTTKQTINKIINPYKYSRVFKLPIYNYYNNYILKVGDLKVIKYQPIDKILKSSTTRIPGSNVILKKELFYKPKAGIELYSDSFKINKIISGEKLLSSSSKTIITPYIEVLSRKTVSGNIADSIILSGISLKKNIPYSYSVLTNKGKNMYNEILNDKMYKNSIISKINNDFKLDFSISKIRTSYYPKQLYTVDIKPITKLPVININVKGYVFSSTKPIKTSIQSFYSFENISTKYMLPPPDKTNTLIKDYNAFIKDSIEKKINISPKYTKDFKYEIDTNNLDFKLLKRKVLAQDNYLTTSDAFEKLNLLYKEGGIKIVDFSPNYITFVEPISNTKKIEWIFNKPSTKKEIFTFLTKRTEVKDINKFLSDLHSTTDTSSLSSSSSLLKYKTKPIKIKSLDVLDEYIRADSPKAIFDKIYSFKTEITKQITLNEPIYKTFILPYSTTSIKPILLSVEIFKMKTSNLYEPKEILLNMQYLLTLNKSLLKEMEITTQKEVVFEKYELLSLEKEINIIKNKEIVLEKTVTDTITKTIPEIIPIIYPSIIPSPPEKIITPLPLIPPYWEFKSKRRRDKKEKPKKQRGITKYAPSLMVSLFGNPDKIKRVPATEVLGKISLNPRVAPTYTKVVLDKNIRAGRGSNIYKKDQDIFREKKMKEEVKKRQKKVMDKMYGFKPF